MPKKTLIINDLHIPFQDKVAIEKLCQNCIYQSPFQEEEIGLCTYGLTPLQSVNNTKEVLPADTCEHWQPDNKAKMEIARAGKRRA